MVTHQLQVRCRPVRVRRSETDVLPLSYTTNSLVCVSVVQRVFSYLLTYLLTYFGANFITVSDNIVVGYMQRVDCVRDVTQTVVAASLSKVNIRTKRWRFISLFASPSVLFSWWWWWWLVTSYLDSDVEATWTQTVLVFCRTLAA